MNWIRSLGNQKPSTYPFIIIHHFFPSPSSYLFWARHLRPKPRFGAFQSLPFITCPAFTHHSLVSPFCFLYSFFVSSFLFCSVVSFPFALFFGLDGFASASCRGCQRQIPFCWTLKLRSSFNYHGPAGHYSYTRPKNILPSFPPTPASPNTRALHCSRSLSPLRWHPSNCIEHCGWHG